MCRVIAVDSDDSDRNSFPRYWFKDVHSHAARTFMLDSFTGLIRVKHPIDRDPPALDTIFVFTVGALVLF